MLWAPNILRNLDLVACLHWWRPGFCTGRFLCLSSMGLRLDFRTIRLAFPGRPPAVVDWKWGFALQEGYPYTAPVWMGEFGGDTRGRYWKHLISYLSVRDVDFAYWSLDGVKLTNGIYDILGHWKPYKHAQWEEETYGLLNSDYNTIRHPWKLLDVQAIMSSPASWTADDYPCDRAVLGNACGG